MTHPMKRLPELPAERALKVIAGRWKIVVLYHLFEEPKRLSELKRLAPGVSDKVLVQQLREMEEHGLISSRGLQAGTSARRICGDRAGPQPRADHPVLVRVGPSSRG